MPIFYSRGGPHGLGGWRRAALAVAAGGLGCAMSVAAWPPRRVMAQSTPSAAATAPDEQRLTRPQLEQMLAPIALHPDALLTQVLIASTYPLEVVQAKRWLGQGNNAALSGDALARALEAQPWDPSVKSLVPFPDVLTMMNDQLDWTQRLGDAVLEQQQDVLNAVQALRARAQAAGKLESGPQQTVRVTQNAVAAPPPPPTAGAPVALAVPPPQEIITIEPTRPDQVCVPAYDPAVVYGTWPYPSNPPAYYPPPVGWGAGNAILTGMAFAGGAALVGSLWGWARPGWNSGDIDVNVNRFNSINANRSQIASGRWQHDVAHRQGVAYRNNEVSNRFRGDTAARAQSREQFRGRVDQAQRGAGIADQRRPGASARPAAAGDRGRPPGAVADRSRPGATNRPGAADRSRSAGAADRGPAGGANRAQQRADRSPGGAQRSAVQQGPSGGRSNVAQQARPSPASRGGASAFSGVGQGQDVRTASARGQASRAAGPAARSGGGGPMAAQRAGGGGGGGRAAAAPRGGGGGRGRR